jgi:hypothetical protein
MRSQIDYNNDQSMLQRSQLAKWEDSAPQCKSELNKMKRDGLTSLSQSAYSISHFCNDLCAAAWFTYVLYYVTEVV